MISTRILRAIVAHLPSHPPPPCLNLGKLFRLGQQLKGGSKQGGQDELLGYASKELQTHFIYALQVLNDYDSSSFQTTTQSLLRSLTSLEGLAPGGGGGSGGGVLKLLRQLRSEQRATLEGFASQVAVLSTPEELKQELTSKFYRANLGSHTLLEELCALLENGKGLVQQLSVESLVNNALAHMVKQGTKRFGGAQLSVGLAGNLEKTLSEERNPLLLHIKPQLQNIVRCLVGQAVYDTLSNHHQQHQQQQQQHPPTVRINVIHGEEDVCIKISDTSGGRSIKSIDNLWKWKWPSPQPGAAAVAEEGCPFANNHGMVALRIVAKYFGGDLDIVPMEGVGNDTYLYLKRNTEEGVVWDEAWEEAEQEWKKWRVPVDRVQL